ncbi:MAG TPA: PKD domain-containing protein, partial [Bacteroidetes bacterium]|nr:PKD domain-containing protein [Bacteroidota bacterium]
MVSISVTNPYTYSWSSGGAAITIPNSTNSLTPLIDPAPLQDTWFYLSITDSFGCSAIDSTLFVYQSLINPVINTIADLCIDTGQIQLTANPAGGVWSGTGIVNTSTGIFDAAQAGVGLTSVSYTITGVCSTVVSKNIVVNALPSIIANPIDESCMNLCNGNINFQINNGVSPLLYSIDSGLSYSSNDSFFNLCPDTFYLFVKDGNSCVDTTSVIINSAPQFQYQSTSFSDTCSMGKGVGIVSISGGTSPYTYSWADSNGIITTVSNASVLSDTLSGLSGQSYFVTITDDNSCQYLDTLIVNSSSPFTITMPIQTPPSCYGYADGAITVLVTGAIPPLIYTWSTGANGTSISGLVADSLYEISVMDSSGCQMLESVMLPVPDTPHVSQIVSDEKCDMSNGDILLNVTGNNGPFSYAWAGGLGSGNYVGGLNAGMYIITITDNNNCQSIKNYQVNNVPPVAAIMNVIDHCFGDNVVLDASGSTNGIISWEWTTSDGGSDTGVNPNYLFPDSGVYGVTLVTTDSNGCNDTASININVYPKPAVYFWGYPTMICNSGYVQFTDSVIAEPGFTYLWDFGPLGTQTISSPSIYFSSPGSYDVSLTVTSVNGCSTILGKNALVNVYNSPLADFFMDPYTTTILDPEIHLDENATGGIEYIWYVGSDSIAQGPMADYIFQDTGRFNI